MKMASVLPVWALVLVASIVVALVSPGHSYFTWLPVVLGTAIVVTFVVQLSLRRKDGFVGRLTLSIVGSFVIVALATALLALVR